MHIFNEQTGTNAKQITFSPNEKGVYLIEVQAPGKNGHLASQFINVGGWGKEGTGKDA